MSALPGSFEGTAVTGLDSSPVEPAAPDLPPLTAQHEAEAADLMARYPQARSALLPMLHLVQSVQGYVSPEGVGFCARLLGLTKAEVGAVATFYTMYKRRPTGDYLVSVCTNISCQLRGGEEIFDCVKQHLGVGHNETTPDGRITLEHAECLAACDFAPVVTVNYEFYDDQTPATALEIVKALEAGTVPAPTRGEVPRTFRDVEMELAGFVDAAQVDAAARKAEK
jgi:NADH-quinone oxidoreductase subunit E